MKISIIMPTFNRKAVLSFAIDALCKQTITYSDYELIIVSDGSTDGTNDLLVNKKKEVPFSLSYISQDHKGVGAARNLGIREAKGDIILFMGDDIIPTPAFLEEHIRTHDEYNYGRVAVQGYTVYHPDLSITPFMYWLANGGFGFAYNAFFDRKEISYKYLYTSNVSINRSFISDKIYYNEKFPMASSEDTEFGYRLTKSGYKIIFNKNALAYHYHPTDIIKECHKAQVYGEASVLLEKMVPGLVSDVPKYKILISNGIVKIFSFSFLKPFLRLMEKTGNSYIYKWIIGCFYINSRYKKKHEHQK